MAFSGKCRTVLGHNNLDFSIDCLKSFIDNSCQPVQLEIFQDGSLTSDDKQKLQASLASSVIIDKQEQSEITLEKLSKYPNCLKWRANNFYAVKIFDIFFYNAESDFLYLDSDVIFFKKFVLPPLQKTPAFMVDSASTYSFGPLDFIQIKEPIFKKLNSGFFYFPVSLLDLDYLERILADPFLNSCFGGKWCGVAEQTIWSFLAAHLGDINYFDPKQICIAEDNVKVGRDTVAIHLVTPFRYQYQRLKVFKKEQDTGNHTEIRLVPVTKHLGKLDFMTEWSITKFNSKLRQLKKSSAFKAH